MPFHDGQTCEEADSSGVRDAASEATKKQISKACPKCKAPIQKTVGCDLMTCICGCRFCWICLKPYTRIRNRAPRGLTRHGDMLAAIIDWVPDCVHDNDEEGGLDEPFPPAATLDDD